MRSDNAVTVGDGSNRAPTVSGLPVSRERTGAPRSSSQLRLIPSRSDEPLQSFVAGKPLP